MNDFRPLLLLKNDYILDETINMVYNTILRGEKMVTVHHKQRMVMLPIYDHTPEQYHLIYDFAKYINSKLQTAHRLLGDQTDYVRWDYYQFSGEHLPKDRRLWDAFYLDCVEFGLDRSEVN